MKLNISIDDVSPHPLSSTRVLRACHSLIEKFPRIKFTLFIPTAYWRTVGETSTNEPLSLHKHPQFCAEIASLPRENFEVGYHGLNHGIPGVSNNDELQHVGFDDALGIIDSMIEVANMTVLGNVFKGIIRPPAWRMSPAAFDACERRGITTFALSPDDYALATYGGAQVGRRVVYYNCCPPMKPLAALEKTEIVYHACEWDVNYLSDKRLLELQNFIDTNEFEFCFIEDLV